MSKFIILGAGFSRNWGGWLASEAFEYLLGCEEIDKSLNELLWRYKDRGGFEAALGHLERECEGRPASAHLIALNRAVAKMFKQMDDGLKSITFEFSNQIATSIVRFLAQFDAIFSLNQDLLLERHYLQHVATAGVPRWSGCSLPGVINQGSSDVFDNLPFTKRCTPSSDETTFRVPARRQPYYKLHGSFNWQDHRDQSLVVIGANKNLSISRSPLLKWYHDEFRSHLSQPDGRLLVVGYGFGDDHINTVIANAVESARLKLFVIDPLGVDVMNQNRGAAIPAPCELSKRLWPNVIGASRRNLSNIFTKDAIERSKLERFLS